MRLLDVMFLLLLAVVTVECGGSYSSCAFHAKTKRSKYSEPLNRFRCALICNATLKYRSYDGTCNNLNNPTWGAVSSQLRRVLVPVYDDGKGTPRTKYGDCTALPNPRDISNVVHFENSFISKKFTTLLMQWGQFIDHDITGTAVVTDSNGDDIDCCPPIDSVKTNPSSSCFPITVPSGDTYYPDNRCINFVRSAAVSGTGTDSSNPRQQYNTLSSFIDGSHIYGVSEDEADRLRDKASGSGLMKTNGQNLLPDGDPEDCFVDDSDPNTNCFKAGDARANVFFGLQAMHILFVREHNRIATALKANHWTWDDETLYQEARRIVGAELQEQVFILAADMVGSVEIFRRRRAAAAIVVWVCSQKKRMKPRRWWVRPWLRRRNRHGAYNALMTELALEDPLQLRKFLRMTAEDMEIILQRIGPDISKVDTNMRCAIPAKERLSLTLRFLASRDSYESMAYLFRIAPNTISKVIPEVCSAIYKHLKDEIKVITYNEWLPVILGGSGISDHGLGPGNYNYNIKNDPRLNNVFSTAAFRFGHSMVPENFTIDGVVYDTGVLFKRTKYVREDMDAVLKSLISERVDRADAWYVDGMRNKMFESDPGKKDGVDLVALNIQRGRDHGLPDYNSWRAYCNLPKITDFRTGHDFGRLQAKNLAQVYKCRVDGIDLYSGGISEIPVKKASVGKLYICLIGEQFQKLRDADRFWHESTNKDTGFTPEQIAELKKVTLARVICDNGDNIDTIQPRVFRQPGKRKSSRNAAVSCDSLRRINLAHWWPRMFSWSR